MWPKYLYHVIQVTIHQSGPADYGTDIEEDNCHDEGYRHLMHLSIGLPQFSHYSLAFVFTMKLMVIPQVLPFLVLISHLHSKQ